LRQRNKFGAWLGWVGIVLTLVKPLTTYVAVRCLKLSPYWGSWAILALMFFDAIDGVLLRWSKLAVNPKIVIARRIANSGGDRVAIQWVSRAAVVAYGFHEFLYGAIVTREFVLYALVAYSFCIKRPLVTTNDWSRLATTCDGLSVITWMLGSHLLSGFCTYGMVVFGVLGLRGYWQTIQATKPVKRLTVGSILGREAA